MEISHFWHNFGARLGIEYQQIYTTAMRDDQFLRTEYQRFTFDEKKTYWFFELNAQKRIKNDDNRSSKDSPAYFALNCDFIEKHKDIESNIADLMDFFIDCYNINRAVALQMLHFSPRDPQWRTLADQANQILEFTPEKRWFELPEEFQIPGASLDKQEGKKIFILE